MAWEKVSAELSAVLEKSLTAYDCQKKQMFGCPAYFLNNNIFAGVHGQSLFLRLPETGRTELLAAYSSATRFEPMPGRIMKEYVVVPKALYTDSPAFFSWIDRSYEFVLSLPLKDPKPKRGQQ